MLKSKTINIAYFTSFWLFNLVNLFYYYFHIGFPIHWEYYVCVFIVYYSIIMYCSFDIRMNFYMKAFSSVKTNEKVISISFDDGPDAVLTPSILDVLKKHQVEAVFFCIGKKIAGNENLLQRMNNEGHIIGNHTYSHSVLFDFFFPRKMIKELQDTEKEIYRVLEKKINLFRPPFGVTNPFVKKATETLNYTVIGWNARSMDTVIKEKTKILARVKGKLNPGAIFLFHDIVPDMDFVIDEFITFAKSQGYRIERVDKLLNISAYE